MSRTTYLLVLLALLSCQQVAPAAEIVFDSPPPPQVKRASERLESRLGDVPGRIDVSRLETRDDWLGDEGYSITSDDKGISVRANSEAGLANGLYTILRTVLVEDLKSPFDKKWDLRDRPCFRWRTLMIAPYSFGAAHGYDVFSLDRWTVQQWQEYLDFLRLGGLNGVYVYAMRPYDPAIPETWPNKTRYEIWKQAMDYAHELGMKFAWMQTGNAVPAELWWRYPEFRPGHEFGWRGCSLCYSKARDIIRKTQRHTLEHFKDADYFVIMFSDGGGGCYCDQCAKDQAAVFMQMVKDTQETLKAIDSKAEVIFFNWLLASWYGSFPLDVPGYHKGHPQVQDIQKNVFKRLSRDIVFEDVGLVPPIPGGDRMDTLKAAKQKGFKTVVNFTWFMNLELPQFMFPRPSLKMTSDAARYTKEAGLDGMDGYRLAPYGRVLNDYAFMRLCWNPDLTTDELIQEMAGYLTEKPEARAKVAEAVALLESYWEPQDQGSHIIGSEAKGPTRDEDIAKATRLLDEAKVGEPSRQLEYLADMTFMLWGVHQLRRPGLSKEEDKRIRDLMYGETTKRYLLQGFGGTQYQWEQEARKYFEALSNIWKE